jgi:hypothetical protein
MSSDPVFPAVFQREGRFCHAVATFSEDTASRGKTAAALIYQGASSVVSGVIGG